MELFGEYMQLIAARYGGNMRNIVKQLYIATLVSWSTSWASFSHGQSGSLLCSMSLLELEAYFLYHAQTLQYLPPFAFHTFRSTKWCLFRKRSSYRFFHGVCHRSWFFSLCGCMDVIKPGLKCRFFATLTDAK